MFRVGLGVAVEAQTGLASIFALSISPCKASAVAKSPRAHLKFWSERQAHHLFFCERRPELQFSRGLVMPPHKGDCPIEMGPWIFWVARQKIGRPSGDLGVRFGKLIDWDGLREERIGPQHGEKRKSNR